MRDLSSRECEAISGGDWHLGFDFGIVDGWIEGDASADEVASAAAAVVAEAYWGARDAMADFYEWAGNGWNFAMACGNP